MAVGFSPLVKGILVLIVVLVVFAIFVSPVKSTTQSVFDFVKNILVKLGLMDPDIKIIEFSAGSPAIKAGAITTELKWEIPNDDKKYIYEHKEDNFKFRFSVASSDYASPEPDKYKVVDEIKLPSNLETADYKIGVGLVRFRLELVREKGDEKVFDSKTVDVGVYNDEYVDLYDRPLDGATSPTEQRISDLNGFINDPDELKLIEPVVTKLGSECRIVNKKLEACKPPEIKTIFTAYVDLLVDRYVKARNVNDEGAINNQRLQLSRPSSDYVINTRNALIGRSWYKCDIQAKTCLLERASGQTIIIKDAKWEPAEGDLTGELAASFVVDTNNPLDTKGYIELWEDWNDFAGGCDGVYNSNSKEAQIPFDLKVGKGEHKMNVKFDKSKPRKITDISKYQYAGEVVCQNSKEGNYCNEDCNSKTFSDYFYKVFIDGKEVNSRSDSDAKINGNIQGKLENVEHKWVRNAGGIAHVTFKAKVKEKPLTGYGYIEIWEDWNEGVWPWEQDKCNSLLNGNGKEARTLLNFENHNGDEIIKETDKIKLEKVTDKTTYSYTDKEDCRDKTFSGYVYRIYFNRDGYSGKLEVKA